MLALLILAVFLAGGVLIFTRALPTILALPMMAIAIAAISVPPWAELAQLGPLAAWAALSDAAGVVTRDIIGAGALMLHAAYATMMAGSMLSVMMKESGVTETLVRVAAELSGDSPFGVSLVMLLLVAVLFTSLGGLGAIIMVGTLVLPLLSAVGVTQLQAASVFLFGISLGGILNPINWKVYEEVLGLELAQVRGFALPLAGLGAIVSLAFLVAVLARGPRGRGPAVREGLASLATLAVAGLRTIPLVLRRDGPAHELPLAAFAMGVLPVALVMLLDVGPLAAFVIALLYGHLALGRRRSVQLLSRSLVEGIAAVAPATALLMGLGMLLQAIWHPSVRGALEPALAAVVPTGPVGYFVAFAVAAPLALYRGPLNVWGLGFGLTGLLAATQLMPPLAIMAALLSVGQIQGICDPTNTHNVWTAGFLGVSTRDILVATLPWAWLLALLGLALAAVSYY